MTNPLRNLLTLCSVATCGVASWAPASLAAQDAPAKEPAPAPASGQSEADKVEALIQQLGARQFAEREAAEKALGDLQDVALDALRQAADSSPDAEIRFRARRILDAATKSPTSESEGGKLRPVEPGKRRLPTPATPRSPGAPEDALESMRRQIEEMMRGGGDLTEQLQRMRDEMDRGLPRTGLPGGGLDPLREALRGLGGGVSGSGTSVQIGPDGVRVEVRDVDEDGKPQTRVYEAPDMESFRRDYPEVAEQYLDGSGLRIGGFGGGLEIPGMGGLEILRPSPREALRPDTGRIEAPPPPSGERLGVMVQPVPPAVVDYLGLQSGRGMLVTEVLAGDLGESLGLQAQDLLLELAGREIGGITDIATALRAVQPGAEVEAVVLRRGQRTALEAVKPAAKPAGEQPESAKTPDSETPGRLRERSRK